MAGRIECICGKWDMVEYIEDYFLWEGRIGHWDNPTFPDAMSPIEALRILQYPEEREKFIQTYKRLDSGDSSYPILEFVSKEVADEYIGAKGLAKAAQRIEGQRRAHVPGFLGRRPPARFVVRWGDLYLLAIGWPSAP
jgi:hypothetical protein